MFAAWRGDVGLYIIGMDMDLLRQQTRQKISSSFEHAVAVDRGTRTLPVGFGSPLITRDELDRYYSAALSVEWPSGWMPVL
jgi:hypothetical protein